MKAFKKFKGFLSLVLTILVTLALIGPVPTHGASDQIAYWNMDETSGSSMDDAWGNNDGTITGASFVTGKVNGGLEFDGDDYVSIGQQDISTPWTVGVWVKYDNSDTNDGCIMSSDNGALKVEQWDNLGKVGYTKYGVVDYTFDYGLPNNQWTHLTFLCNGSTVSLYVNGQFEDSKNGAIDCPMNVIGKGKGNSGYLTGTLDELKVYNRVLSSAEISDLAGVPHQEAQLSRASRIFIEKGLQMQAWVTTDDTGRYVLNPDDWDELSFTAPTYYEAPMYNSDFHAARPDSQWSLAKAPYYNQLSGPPASNDHFLSQEQRDNLSNLVSMCFGDEEGYSYNHVQNLKAWYDLSRSLYPDVLVHNNQWSGQWSESNLRYYIQQAKPDLLTFDTYHFDQNNTPGYEFVRHCANSLGLYRELALEGYDGSGDSPIAFGQYLLGYVTGNAPYAVGQYRISQSQINLIPFTTLTMGGKWLNYFRWLQDNAQVGLFYDANGDKTDEFYYYANMAKEIGNLGDHLMRLKSTDLYMVRGQHMQSGQAQDNALPSRIGTWQSSVDAYITDITVTNLGQVNDQLAGDVMVGYFEPLQGLTDDMKALFTCENPEYFMILNGLVNDDGLTSNEKDMDSCDDAKQRVTLTIDLGSKSPDALKRVSRDNGQVDSVMLTPVSGTTYTLEVELGGGKADLFFWE